MRWPTRFCAACLWLLLSAVALGGITLPTEAEVGDKVVATVSATVPEGATFDGGWSIVCEDSCTASYEELKQPNAIGIWAKNNGKYTVKYSGFWLLLKEVTFKDGDGNDVTITSYLGHGFISEEAEITIGGGDDKPDPPVPPPGKAWGLILEETSNSSPQWARLRVSLRTEFDKLNKRLLILDESNLSPSLQKYAQAVRESQLELPVLVVVTADGAVVSVKKCPDTVDGVKKELGL